MKQSKINSVLWGLGIGFGIGIVVHVFTPVGDLIQRGWAMYSLNRQIKRINEMDLSSEETLQLMEHIDVSGLSYNSRSAFLQCVTVMRESVAVEREMEQNVNSSDTIVTLRGRIFDLSKREENAEFVSWSKRIIEELEEKRNDASYRLTEALKSEFDI